MSELNHLALLDQLSYVLEKASSRRRFLTDPWGTLRQAGITPPDDPDDPVNVLVDTLAEMSFQELSLIGRFGTGIREVLGPAEIVF